MLNLRFLEEALRNTPFENKVYLAGGAVRDNFLGLPVKDLDFVVVDNGLDGALRCAEHVAKFYEVYRPDSNPVIFPTYGTAKLRLLGEDLEFVAPRIEHYVQESRKPSVELGNLQDDAMRRDFTANSLFMMVCNEGFGLGGVVDPTGRGLDDLNSGVLDTTDNPDRIFSDDPLRMLRAFRFSCKYNLTMTDRVKKGIQASAHRMNIISNERVHDELCKILVLPKPSVAFEMMRDLDFLGVVFPEVQAMMGVTQNEYHIHDVFGHTMAVLDASENELHVRLAALLHDIGKPATRAVVTKKDGSTKIQFLDHAFVGNKIAQEFMRRLKFSNDRISMVSRLVLYHMDLKPAGFDGQQMSDGALRKFVHRVGDVRSLAAILLLMDADNKCHAECHSMPDQIEGVKSRLSQMDLDAVMNTAPILDGHKLKELGLTGPLLGKVTKRLVQKQLENSAFDTKDAASLALNMLRDWNKKNENPV